MGLPIEVDIYNALTDSPTLVSLVSSSIYPDRARQGASMPGVVYNRVSGVRILSLSGYTGLENPRFQFNVYSTNVDALEDVSGAVIGALTSSTCFKTVADDAPEDYYSDETQTYVRIFDVSFWHQD